MGSQVSLLLVANRQLPPPSAIPPISRDTREVLLQNAHDGSDVRPFSAKFKVVSLVRLENTPSGSQLKRLVKRFKEVRRDKPEKTLALRPVS